jgi:hypothetical protein
MDKLEHHGVKGMHWGERKAETSAPPKRFASRVSREYETALAIGAVAALGVAYVKSPTAQTVMRVPVSAAVHYMSNKEHRRKVGKVLYKTGILYSKL